MNDLYECSIVSKKFASIDIRKQLDSCFYGMLYHFEDACKQNDKRKAAWLAMWYIRLNDKPQIDVKKWLDGFDDKSSRVSPFSVRHYRRSCVVWCIEQNRNDILELLSCHPSTCQMHRYYAYIVDAARLGLDRIVELFLENIDYYRTDYIRTGWALDNALEYAAENDNLSTVKLLIINDDEMIQKCLNAALLNKSYDVANYLLTFNHSVDRRTGLYIDNDLIEDAIENDEWNVVSRMLDLWRETDIFESSMLLLNRRTRKALIKKGLLAAE